MEAVSLWLNGDLLPAMLAVALELEAAARAHVIEAAILLALAVISAVAARSVLVLIATLLVACLSLVARNRVGDGDGNLVFAVAGTLALVILTFWTVWIRKRFTRQSQRIQALTAQNAETQRLLDREIEWRQAGEASRAADALLAHEPLSAPSARVEPDR